MKKFCICAAIIVAYVALCCGMYLFMEAADGIMQAQRAGF